MGEGEVVGGFGGKRGDNAEVVGGDSGGKEGGKEGRGG